MKNLNMLIWLTQLGCSAAFPPAGFTLAAVWLKQKFNLGIWVVLLGIAIGFVCGVEGFRSCLKTMERLSEDQKKDDRLPSVSFNDHQ